MRATERSVSGISASQLTDNLTLAQTLRTLGALLQHVEASGEASGLEVSTGELHFLDLFRCVVDANKVLTPLISDGIERQLSKQDLQNPTVLVRSCAPLLDLC